MFSDQNALIYAGFGKMLHLAWLEEKALMGITYKVFANLLKHRCIYGYIVMYHCVFQCAVSVYHVAYDVSEILTVRIKTPKPCQLSHAHAHVHYVLVVH